MTDILLVHGNELAREKFIKVTGANVTLIQLEGSSSAYDEYARQNPRINGPVILVAFSAGVWALRRWLRDPSNREQVTAVVILGPTIVRKLFSVPVSPKKNSTAAIIALGITALVVYGVTR